MTIVPSSPRTTTFTLASAGLGPFDVGFRIFDPTVRVYVNDIERFDFILSGTFANGFSDNATISFSSNLPIGSVVRIDGAMPIARGEEYFNPDPNLTRNLNIEQGRQWAGLQQIQRDVGRNTAVIQAFSDMIAGAAEDSQAAEEAAEQAEAFGKIYTETDAQLALITIPAGAQVIQRLPSAPGQVAPLGIVTRWQRNDTPGPQPYFTTAGGVTWTVAEITQADYQAMLTAAIFGILDNPVLTGQARLANGTAALPSLTFGSDLNTGLYRFGADNIGITTNGTVKVVVGPAAMLIDVPIVGNAVTLTPTDATPGKLMATGASATTLSASPANRLASGGTANALTVTSGAGISGVPPTGMQIRFRAAALNTGATTLALDGGLARPCLTITGVALPAGYIRIGFDTTATFDGVNWVLDRVVEPGSNANGNFVRYADGRMKCEFVATGVDTTAAAGALFMHTNLLSWTFPAPFAVAPIVTGNGGSAARWLAPALPTTTAAEYRVYSFGSSGATDQPRLQAVGRWF